MGRPSVWVLLGLMLLAVSCHGFQVAADVVPSESECRPYIDKALNQLKTGETTGDLSDETHSTDEVTVDDDRDSQNSQESNENASAPGQPTSDEQTESHEDKDNKSNESAEHDKDDSTSHSHENNEADVASAESGEHQDDDDDDSKQNKSGEHNDSHEDDGKSHEEDDEQMQGDQPASNESEQKDDDEASVEDANKSAEDSTDSQETKELEDDKNDDKSNEDNDQSVEGDNEHESGEKTEDDNQTDEESGENKDTNESNETIETVELSVEHAENVEALEGQPRFSKEDLEKSEEIQSQEDLDASEEMQQDEPAADEDDDSKSEETKDESKEKEDSKSDEAEGKSEASEEAKDDESVEGAADVSAEDEADKAESVEDEQANSDTDEEHSGESAEKTEKSAESEEDAVTSEKSEEKSDEKSEEKQESVEKEDEKSEEKDDDKSDEKSEEKSDEKSEEKHDEKSDEKSEEKHDEKSDEKDDSKSDEKGDEKSEEKDDDKSDESVEDKSQALSVSEESHPEDDLLIEYEIPTNLRDRSHIAELLHLDNQSIEKESAIDKVAEVILKDLKRIYENAIKPLETLYKYRDLSNRHFGDPEIFSKPLVLFMGPWSGGKSTILNYLSENEYTPNSIRTGAEPSPAYFNILMHGDEPEVLDGTQLAADWTFSGLQKFGQGLEDRLRGHKLPSKLLEKVNIVEIPGILEVRKQVSRLFPFNDACQWFIDRADIIFLVYDPSKLDVGPETEAILDQLKGREYQTRIVLNKADQVKPEELLRVQGALIWNISPLMSSAQPPIMYTTSLWSNPYETGAPIRLLQAQERALLRDLRNAIDKRIENKIASARRFAVRVRNHAKMVDCYLTTYYNHKSLFGNKKLISDQIIEHPQNYHIYEGLSTLTNISRYDLPDPEVYRDFFRLNPLYEFKKLSETCTYFRGCPINKLDIAIAYDLPELGGKYKKALDAAFNQLENSTKDKATDKS